MSNNRARCRFLVKAALAVLGLVALRIPARGQLDTFSIPQSAIVNGTIQPSTASINFTYLSSSTMVSGFGISFTANNVIPGGSTVTLTSSQQIQVMGLQALGGDVSFDMAPAGGGGIATLTFSGLKPDATYYYRPTGGQETPYVVAPGGTLSVLQDISEPRHVVLLAHKGTIFINGDGSVSPATALASISVNGDMYTLTQDLHETLVIERSGATLDGKGHAIDGAGTGAYGGIAIAGQPLPIGCPSGPPGTPFFYFNGSCNITVRNVVVKNFPVGIQMSMTANASVIHSTITNNSIGLIVNAEYGATVSSNVFINNTSEDLRLGFNINNVYVGNVIGSSANVNTVGMHVYPSGDPTFYNHDNIFQGNTILGELHGFSIQEALGFKFIGNTVDARSIPYLIPPALGVGFFFTRSANYTGQQIALSSNTFYVNTQGTSGIAILTDQGLGNRFEYNAIPYPGIGIFLMGPTNPAFPVGSDQIVSNSVVGYPTYAFDVINVPGVALTNNTASAFNVGILGGSVISSNIVTGLYAGIQAPGGATVSYNTISAQYGTALSATNDVIHDNLIADSKVGIDAGGGNQIYHNDFVRNKTQVNSQATAPNTWNLPWPVGGNYFDDYTAPDNFYGTSQGTPGSDRVVDAPRVFNAGNQDNFPFTLPDRWQVPDRMPPNPITDLTVTPASFPGSVFLSWTVPGDPDGIGAPARSYDIRFGPNPITSPAVFDSLPQHPLFQDSTPVGSRTGYTIQAANYFAVKALDEPAHNASALSNMGGQINYLSLSGDSKVAVVAGIQLNITNYPAASPVVSGALAIATSLGLTLVSNNVYDLSPVTAFSPAASLSFAYDPAVVTNPGAIAVYRYDGTTWQTGPATGITNQVVDTANSRITANIAHTSLWALFTKASDVLPPRTALNVGLPRHGTTPVLINTFTPLSFSVADDFRVVGDSAGVGVAATYYAVDGSTFSLYASSFTIPVEGFHSIRFYSVDKAGNQETVNISTVGVDHTPPITQVGAGSPVFYAVDGSTYVSPASSIGLSVVDPAVGGVAAGPQVTFYTLDGGGLTQYSSSFTLTEGAHSLTFQSGDWVGNIENPKTATLKTDGTPPSTQLVIQGTQTVSGGVVYVSPGAVFSFAAQDPVSHGVASGVGRTLYSVDGGAPGAFLAAFALSTGAHALTYQSVDNVGNVETLRVSSFTIRPNDLLPPRTTLLVGRPAYGASPLLVTSATPFGLSAVDDALTVGDGAGGGVARSYYAIDGGAFLAFSSSFAISGAGSHLIRYYSVDLVGNAEAVRSSTVAVDDAPPATSLAISTPLYAGYVSSSAVFSLSAVDPLVSGVASGVAGTFVSLGTAPAAAYAGPFTLAGPEGAKTISYHSVDNLSNAEVVHSTTALLDATPPVTVVSIGASSFTASGAIYVAVTTPVSFTAADPPLAPGVPGSGVARVLVSVDGGPYTTVTAPLNFAEGLHSILYQAVDNVGNVEPLRALTLRSDGTPPATAFTPSGAFFSAGARNYAPASFFYALSAADPVSNSVASGLASTRYALDGGAFQTYASTFSLAEGVRQVAFQSQDNVGNLEPAKSATVYVDATAPVTSLLIAGGRQFSGPDGVYVSADARLALTTLDPGAPGAASGVALTRWQDNGGAFQVYGTSIALSEGAHVVAYQSQDNVQNLEVLRSTVIFVDATAPNSAAGVGAPSYTAADGTLYIGTATLVSITASDPALPGGHAGSGVARVEVSVDSAAYGAYSAPLTFAAGRHSVLYRAVDQTGNVEPAHSLAVSVDATAPVTTLTVSTPNSGGFVSAATLFSLSAVDPAVGGVASGAAATRYSLDGGAFAAYTAPFGLVGADGPHVIAYLSADNLGNTESVRSVTFQLDQTPPVAAAHVGAPSYTASDGTLYVTPATPVTFTAADAGSGVDRIEVAVDGGSYAAYASALTFAEGRHAIFYRAVDRVGNVAPARTLSLRSDATRPMTALSPSGAFFTANSRDYASAGFFYTLTANDPASNSVASGLALTRYALDGGAFQTYVSTFGLVEGVRQVAFQSQDNVGNLELLKSATVYVDATPPATALTIGQPQYASPAGTLFVGPAATFVLSAQDPVVQGVASGVSAVSARVDAGAYSLYGASFTLTPGDGLRTVGWFSVDNVGNAETPKISTVALDATPPLTSLLVVGGRQFPGPNAAAFYASSDTRLALPAVDPVVNGAASGIAFTQYQDNGGAFQTFTAPFGLPEGAHALGYQSQDRVANLEVLRSTTVLVDAAPPVTTAHIGTPLFVAADGTDYITAATPITFTAADPALAGTTTPGSGVNRIEASIDGGAFAAYSAALTFAEGRHTILFRSIDNVGNVEAAQTLNIRSDNTSPMTALAVIGGKQAASAAANSFYASADSRFGLPAVDPVVNNVASGIAFTRYQDNGGAFQTFTVPVALTEGSHLLAYQSQDNVGNAEVLRSTTVLIDATPPVSTAAIGSPLFIAADGTNYITPATPVTLSAFDPAANGLASGVDHIETNIDGAGYAAYTAYTSTLTFAEGRHTVLFRAVDRVGNVEAAHTLLLQSDNTPPVTAIQPSGTLFTVMAPEGPRSYAPVQFTYSLPATDPVVSGVASGLAFTRYRAGSAFQPFVASFSLAEGIRRVDFQSQDNVGNQELPKSATVYVDATPPVTALAIGGPKFDPGSGQAVFISVQTQLSLSAVDPVVQEVASGVSSVFFRRNADPFAAYASSFTLPLPDGFKTVAWYAVDNVGNQELAKATTVFLDNTPPQTGLTVIGGHQFPGSDAMTFYASGDTRLALPAVDPIAGGAASGLAFTQYQDNGGAFQTFAAPFGLAEGAHALGYRSQDKVQNMEVLRSTNVWVDAAPPVSSFAFG
ncbi:MAG: hypothetical protein KGL74_00740, partial [Elusimicrobia bacterium]|nr:hypothetical protein [Elusimicrobiota bacterium]